MPFTAEKPGPGRPPGIANKATSAAREAIAQFVDGNAPRLQAWLDEVANGIYIPQGEGKPSKLVVLPNPQKAFELFQSVIEYHIPKLARIETTGDKGVQIFIGCRDSDVAIISSSELPDSAKSLTPQDIDVPLCLPKVSDETLEK